MRFEKLMEDFKNEDDNIDFLVLSGERKCHFLHAML